MRIKFIIYSSVIISCVPLFLCLVAKIWSSFSDDIASVAVILKLCIILFRISTSSSKRLAMLSFEAFVMVSLIGFERRPDVLSVNSNQL